MGYGDSAYVMCAYFIRNRNSRKRQRSSVASSESPSDKRVATGGSGQPARGPIEQDFERRPCDHFTSGSKRLSLGEMAYNVIEVCATVNTLSVGLVK